VQTEGIFLRVITGSARGRVLKTLSGDATRPTTDKVKEAIFSAIQFDVEGRRVLDLFAGSGQMGIEALSRDAAHCVFVDANKQAVEVVRENLQKTDLADKASVICRRAEDFLLAKGETFDLVFLDPPYGMELLPELLEKLPSLLSSYATVICEHDIRQTLPEHCGELTAAKTKKYGKIGVTIYRKR
jgi:16S rRNA (guanine(966)-N(2))-methyltransferase RsmD